MVLKIFLRMYTCLQLPGYQLANAGSCLRGTTGWKVCFGVINQLRGLPMKLQYQKLCLPRCE
ncbi:Uncharacterized protein DAT39_013980, partial [Clarias magur]